MKNKKESSAAKAKKTKNIPKKKSRGRPRKSEAPVFSEKTESKTNDKATHSNSAVPKKRGRPPVNKQDNQALETAKKDTVDQNINAMQLSPNQLVLKHISLVEAITHGLMTHVPPHIERSDLISEGYIGLIEASKRFDHTKGVKFETFARTRIQGAMYDWLRSLDLLPRSARDKLKNIEMIDATLSKQFGRPAKDTEIANTLGIGLADYQKSITSLSCRFIPIDSTQTDVWNGSDIKKSDLKDESFKDPVEKIYAERLWVQVNKCLENFNERERLILSLMSIENLNLKEIGAVLDYSSSTVRQMREKAILELKEYIKILRVAG